MFRGKGLGLMGLVAVAVVSVSGVISSVLAQAPGVEIVRDKGNHTKEMVAAASALREKGKLLSVEEVSKQLDRETCSIDLPKPNTTKRLTDREIWQRSKAAHLRVGWHYRCKKCDHWHDNLAGGYFINTNGAAATCFHVINKDKDSYRDGYLIAVNDAGEVLPVTEVLAANEDADVAILQVKTDEEVTPLPLNKNVYPGDPAWCYSDPLGRSGYFSKGMINRFYYAKRKSGEESPRIEVSTDWAPGSSGASVLDEYGNAIGHVSEISSAGTRGKKPVVSRKKGSTNLVFNVSSSGNNSVIVFHCASRAADVLSLVK